MPKESSKKKSSSSSSSATAATATTAASANSGKKGAPYQKGDKSKKDSKGKGAGAGTGRGKGKGKGKGQDGKIPNTNPIHAPKPKSFRIGADILPKKRDLGRYVRWPRYVRIQRQRKILQTRLKVPPAINQFHAGALPKNQAEEVFKVLKSMKPESKTEKKTRLHSLAQSKATAAGGDADAGTPGKPKPTLKFGLAHVTRLIEQKEAKLVIIANNVNPLELVVWMPALCRKMDVPYVIVKDKSRLGEMCGMKTATCLAVKEVPKEEQARFGKVTEMARGLFNDNVDMRRKWGGGIMGRRTQVRVAKHEAAIAAERAKKAKILA